MKSSPMSTYNKVMRNIFSSWAGLLVNIVISFFLAPFVVSSLGNVYYGIWVIMMQFTGYLYLMDFGVRESVVRFVSKYHAKKHSRKSIDVINAAIMMYSILGIITIIIVCCLAIAFPYIFDISEENITLTRLLVFITGFTISQTFVFNVFRGILMALQRYDIFYKIGIVFQLIRVVLIVTLLNLGYGVIALGVIQFVISLGSSLVMYFVSRKIMDENDIKFKFVLLPYTKFLAWAKKLFNYSFFVLVNNLSQKAIFTSDAMVIGIFMPTSAVTFYAIAGTLIDYIRKLSKITAQVFNPLASELESKNDNERLKLVLIQGSKLSLLIGLPVVMVYVMMGSQFIGLWMGPEYAELSGKVLFVLAVSQILSLPHYTVSSILYGISKHNIIAYLHVLEAIANLALSIILVQSMGIIGVAFGTAIPHIIVVMLILPVIISKILNMNYFTYILSSYVSPLISIIPFTAACYWVNTYYPASNLLYFFMEVILLLPVYGVTAWYLSFTKEERVKYSGVLISVLKGSRGKT